MLACFGEKSSIVAGVSIVSVILRYNKGGKKKSLVLCDSLPPGAPTIGAVKSKGAVLAKY